MAVTWNDAVRRTGRLNVYADPSLRTGTWGSLLGACIREFNRLSTAHTLGVRLEDSGDPPVCRRRRRRRVGRRGGRADHVPI